jgi:hypothetical protein
MKFQEGALDAAIAYHAVALNRIQWVDPDRLGMQQRAWTQIMNRACVNCAGAVTLDDVYGAIRSLMASGDSRECVPERFVLLAARRAAERADEARTIIDTPAGQMLMTERLRHEHRMRSAHNDADAAENIELFRADVHEVVSTLRGSGLPDDEIAPALERIARGEAAVIAATRWTPRTELGGPRPSVDEFAKVVADEAL